MMGMFISTFYGVFHYLTDSITGIILSFIINLSLTKIFKL
jgi:membrane-associated phospholipid phosphatase